MLSAFETCIRGGGIALFPSDTVYGLACDPENPAAVERLYALKGRAPDKPAAVMWFDRAAALAALPDLGPRTRAAAEALLPGPVTLLVPNPAHRFPLACGPDPDTLGVRVPQVPGLRGAQVAVLQTSANLAGGPDPRTLDDVPPEIRAGVDLALDAGALGGVASTVLDLRAYEAGGAWRVVRQGAASREAVAAVL